MRKHPLKRRILTRAGHAIKSTAFVLILLAVQACSAPQTYRSLTIDGSNAASTEQSVQRIVRSMPQSQQAEFLLALVKIQVQSGQQQPAALLHSDSAMQHVNYQFIGQQTHGLTYLQVIEQAKRLQ
jgi:uncharacterized protein YigA (DUF484 family)